MTSKKKATGLRQGLATYGDAGFSLFLRKAFIKAGGYSDDALDRPIVAGWGRFPLMVCPSTAPQVALGLGAIDPEVPDGRPMIVADDPYFAIHRWEGGQLVSHLDTAADHQVLAHYTPKLQPLVRMLISEKEGSTLLDLG